MLLAPKVANRRKIRERKYLIAKPQKQQLRRAAWLTWKVKERSADSEVKATKESDECSGGFV